MSSMTPKTLMFTIEVKDAHLTTTTDRQAEDAKEAGAPN